MERRNIWEKIKDNTAMESKGFRTLHKIPNTERAYFRFNSRDVSCCMTNQYCRRFSPPSMAIPPVLFVSVISCS